MAQPIWISHRGSCLQATENTREAFDAALTLGFSHFETDLRTTRDGHLVLCHDPDLMRTAGLAAIIEQTTRAELIRLKLRGGESLLFFDELIERYGQYRWILDIKPEGGLRSVTQLLHCWTQPAYADFLNTRVRFLFWRTEQQRHLLGHHPDAICMMRESACRRAGLFCLLGLPSLADLKSGATYALPPDFHGLDLMRPELVARYHQRGARVLAFLPETDEEVGRALEAGVDEILTNHSILS